MSILFTMSKQVESMQPYIIQNNDQYEGERALIANIDRYYPGLELDTPETKLLRWERAPKYIYYPKIVSSFTSSIFKKPPHSELPIDAEDLRNVDLLGNSLTEYVAKIPEEVLKQGFCATIIDYSNELSVPYLSFIASDQFVSFRTSNTKGYPELSQFIYHVEEEVPDEVDEFKLKLIDVHYVWDLFNGQTRVRKYERREELPDQTVFDRKRARATNQYSDLLISTNMLSMNGKPLDFLPIVMHGKNTNNFLINKSVLQDVSDLNIHLYNRVVDQIEVLHLTALPTPYVLGIDPDDKDTPKTIGSSKLWVIGNPDAKVGMLEFSGESAEAHTSYIEQLTYAMAVQGAQILKRGGVSRETATSVLIRTSQETSVITDIVNNISNQIIEVLNIYFAWGGESIADISYRLNSDFVNVDIEPNAQIALVKSWMDGAVSYPTVFQKLKQGEIIKSDRKIEDELADIKKYPPPFFAKEKDAEIAEEQAEEQAKLDVKVAGENQQSNNNANQDAADKSLSGSNMEIDNGTKNTEITN